MTGFRILSPFGAIGLVLLLSVGATAGQDEFFIRGDVMDDGVVNPSDVTALLSYLYAGGPVPRSPIDRADANDNEFVNATDILRIEQFLFLAGPWLSPPWPDPGPDPDDLVGPFGSVQPGYEVTISLASVTEEDVALDVAIDSLESVVLIDVILDLDPALAPASPAFAFAPGLSGGTSEFEEGRLFGVTVIIDRTAPLAAGRCQALGTLLFTHDGSIPDHPSTLPVTWVPQATVRGIERRASIATADLVDHHPGISMGPCGGANVPFTRGDINADGFLDVADPVAALMHIFASLPVGCLDAVDVDDSGGINIADPIYTLNFIFLSGAPPFLPPWRECGEDPSEDDLGCEAFPPCE
ncbi:MAG: hypothetical protein JXP34_21445 [Planctomycetes bacterium]|nr:hypothetical protein [Planctomycetota bacterium]